MSRLSSRRPSRGLNRSYSDALDRLNRLQTSFQTLEENQRTGRKSNRHGVTEMKKWIRNIGYTLSDLDRLRVIHVAGTKGKGSTCAYVDSILRELRLTSGYPKKAGLYTSPHLKHVRERIQINSRPMSEELFTKHFFKIWDKIASHDQLDPDERPGYFRFLTIMSYAVFLEEDVTAAIYETGIGGERDSTNVVQKPVVTGITELGIDHVKTLQVEPANRPSYMSNSSIIEDIAWHKAGIFKSGCPAFSVQQQPAAREVLRHRAEERGAPLTVIEDNHHLKSLKFDSSVQLKNASLAVALVESFLKDSGKPSLMNQGRYLPEVFRGLENSHLAGRCQILVDGASEWYIDGAHTEESLIVAGQWYSRPVKSKRSSPASSRVLIFNNHSQRDGEVLLRRLFSTLQHEHVKLDHVIFCTNRLSETCAERPDYINRNRDPVHSIELQGRYRDLWIDLAPNSDVRVVPTIEGAISLARSLGGGTTQTLVTGSLHLVGGVLYILEGPDAF